MADFSPLDAALEGFKLPREHPRAVLIWTGVLFVTSLLISTGLILLGGHEYAAFIENMQAGHPDPRLAEALVQRVFPFVFPIGLLTLSVFSSAVYRLCLRPGAQGVGYLQLGLDELRIAALTVINIGLWALYVFAVSLAGGVIAGVLARVNGSLSVFFALAYGLGSFCLTVWVFVRLSLAAPQTFAEHRLCIFDSWGLTKGHFWKMLGAYALSFALVAIVWLLALMISQGLILALHGGNLQAAQANSGNVTSLTAYFSLQTIIVLAFNAFLNALFYGLMFSPGTVIYQELVQSAATKAQAFS